MVTKNYLYRLTPQEIGLRFKQRAAVLNADHDKYKIVNQELSNAQRKAQFRPHYSSQECARRVQQAMARQESMWVDRLVAA